MGHRPTGRRGPTFRSYFFGRRSLGLWPILVLFIGVMLAGGTGSLEEFSQRALPIVLGVGVLTVVILLLTKIFGDKQKSQQGNARDPRNRYADNRNMRKGYR